MITLWVLLLIAIAVTVYANERDSAPVIMVAGVLGVVINGAAILLATLNNMGMMK